MTNHGQKSQIKAVCFDFMGTCLNWHSVIVSYLPPSLPEKVKSDFALEWRQTYFDTNDARIRRGEAPEDIDVTHRHALAEVLDKHADIRDLFTEAIVAKLIQAWHLQVAWPDVAAAVKKLRQRGLEVFVHANGTTRLQLDLVRSSGLVEDSGFDMLFSSELLGVYKPQPESFEKLFKLIKRKPEECVMVAAHAYDVRGAKKAGMKTIYVYRWSDDILEDQEKVKQEGFDIYLQGMTGLDAAVASL